MAVAAAYPSNSLIEGLVITPSIQMQKRVRARARGRGCAGTDHTSALRAAVPPVRRYRVAAMPQPPTPESEAEFVANAERLCGRVSPCSPTTWPTPACSAGPRCCGYGNCWH